MHVSLNVQNESSCSLSPRRGVFDSLDVPGHVGLLSMPERAPQAADRHRHQRPGSGTKVEALLPGERPRAPSTPIISVSEVAALRIASVSTQSISCVRRIQQRPRYGPARECRWRREMSMTTAQLGAARHKARRDAVHDRHLDVHKDHVRFDVDVVVRAPDRRMLSLQP